MAVATSKGRVRWMLRKDAPEVVQITESSFEKGWTEDDLVEILKQRNAIGYVYEIEERVVAFMIYFLYKHKIEIGYIAVDPRFRNQGIFSDLISKAKSRIDCLRKKKLYAHVDEYSLVAQVAFRQVGFWASSIERIDGVTYYRFEFPGPV